MIAFISKTGIIKEENLPKLLDTISNIFTADRIDFGRTPSPPLEDLTKLVQSVNKSGG